MAVLSPVAKQQFHVNGVPAAGYKLYTYATGTSTPQATYTDRAGATPHTNPIILDSDGYVPSGLYLTLGVVYDYVLKTAAEVTAWTRPGVAADQNDAVSVNFEDDVAPAYLKTVSDIINGEQVSVFRNIPKAKWAGIRESTNTDNLTDNINDLLVAMGDAHRGKLFVPHGTYHAINLECPGNMVIEGEHSIIKGHASLGSAQQLFGNTTLTGAVDATFDDNITLRSLRFHVDAAADRTVPVIGFSKCGDLRLENVAIRGGRYMGVLLFGCKRVWLDRLKVTETGKETVSEEGGAGIHISPHSDGSTCDDIYVQSPRVNDCEWAGIYATGNRILITNPSITTVKEAGIFGVANGLDILGGFISNVTKKYISGSGIELGGLGVNIGAGLTIDGVDNCGVSLTDMQSATINGLRTINVRRDAATYPTATHVSILSTEASPNQSRDIFVSGHSAVDYTDPAYAAVGIVASGAGSPAVNVKISNNNYSPTTFTSGKAVYIGAGGWDEATCEHRDNFGNDDSSTACVAVQSVGNDQTLTTATLTAVTFDAASPNSTGPTGTAMWVVGTPTRITCHEAGKVIVAGQTAFTANATGIRSIRVRKNGSDAYAGRVAQIVNNVGASYTQQVSIASGVIEVAAGDYFELFAQQDSGGNLDTVAAESQVWLSVRYV